MSVWGLLLGGGCGERGCEANTVPSSANTIFWDRETKG